MNDSGNKQTGTSDSMDRIRRKMDEIQGNARQAGDKMDVKVNSALQSAYRSLTEAAELMNKGGQQTRQQGIPSTGSSEIEPSQEDWGSMGGQDRSSSDPEDTFRSEVHPDDASAPPSDTGHREVHPDDVDV